MDEKKASPAVTAMFTGAIVSAVATVHNAAWHIAGFPVPGVKPAGTGFKEFGNALKSPINLIFSASLGLLLGVIAYKNAEGKSAHHEDASYSVPDRLASFPEAKPASDYAAKVQQEREGIIHSRA